jgi:hypothetical protein
MQRVDILDVEADMSRARVAGPHSCGDALNPTVLDELQRVFDVRDPQVDDPDFSGIERGHSPEVIVVGDAVDVDLETKSVPVEGQGSVHILDREPAVPGPENALPIVSHQFLLDQSDEGIGGSADRRLRTC